MNYKQHIGIDVSKEKLDICVMDDKGCIEQELIIENSTSSWRKQIGKWKRNHLVNLEQALFCLEPTGHYSNTTVACLLESGSHVWIAIPSDIRNSIGMQRGKNDQIDAARIAEYAYRFEDKVRLVRDDEIDRQELQQLLTQREMLVKDRAKYLTQVSDYKGRIGKKAYAIIRKMNEQFIKQLSKAIEELNKQLDLLINQLPVLSQQYKLIQTIPGIGKVLAQTMVVFTNGFTRFNTPRALACHAGVAPFEYKSGSSVRGKNKVSSRSNKRLKSLLHMAALSAIRTKGDLSLYYKRKVAEGKNKMNVLNAIRNKIIHRIFAVLKRNTEYRLELP